MYQSQIERSKKKNTFKMHLKLIALAFRTVLFIIYWSVIKVRQFANRKNGRKINVSNKWWFNQLLFPLASIIHTSLKYRDMRRPPKKKPSVLHEMAAINFRLRKQLNIFLIHVSPFEIVKSFRAKALLSKVYQSIGNEMNVQKLKQNTERTMTTKVGD